MIIYLNKKRIVENLFLQEPMSQWNGWGIGLIMF